MRAAASSSARGSPSSSRAISSTESSGSNRGFRSRARCTNSSAASAGGSVETGYSCSIDRLSRVRLVASTRISGQAASSSARMGGAAGSCSRLSSTSSKRLERSASRSSPDAPTTLAIVGSRRASSVTGARGTNHTPFGQSPIEVSAASRASLVLPVPPGPVSVTRGASERMSLNTSASSSARATKLIGGRIEVRVRDRQERRKPAASELEQADRLVEVLQRVLTEIGRRRVHEAARGLAQQHLPAVACRHDPRGKVHVEPDVSRRIGSRLAGVDPDPHRERLPFGPRGSCQGLLSLGGRGDGRRRLCKCHEEGVALGIHFVAVVALEGLTQEAPVLPERVRVAPPAQPAEQARRPFDVGEQQGHRSGRLSRHPTDYPSIRRRCQLSASGAAQESNLPSRGLHDRTGFEDQLGHRAHAAPSRA